MKPAVLFLLSVTTVPSIAQVKTLQQTIGEHVAAFEREKAKLPLYKRGRVKRQGHPVQEYYGPPVEGEPRQLASVTFRDRRSKTEAIKTLETAIKKGIQLPYFTMRTMRVGYAGRFNNGLPHNVACYPLQIIDTRTALVEFRFAHTRTDSQPFHLAWLTTPTEGMLTNQPFDLDPHQVYMITGTRQYTTIAGTSQTIVVIEPDVKGKVQSLIEKALQRAK